MKQFLLKSDGTFPPNTNVEALKAAGIRFVLPTPRPRPSPGMMLRDTEPELINGVWHQRWTEVPAPEEPTE
jgi:uncharacterized LabA/DUF88 family protein